MKRLKILIVLFLSFSLTGCIQEYTISEERSNAVADYMAGLLLKYDANYEQNLIPEDEIAGNIEEEENSTENSASDTQTTPSESPSTTDTADAVVDSTEKHTLTEVIGLKDFKIEYSSYKLAKTYPEDPDSAGFSLTPRDGYQLLVISFTVENKSDSKKDLNLINAGINYQLDINVGTVYKPVLTLLENDLKYINIAIGGGKSEEALLVFEVSKDADMTNVNLIVSKDDKSDIIEIK